MNLKVSDFRNKRLWHFALFFLADINKKR